MSSYLTQEYFVLQRFMVLSETKGEQVLDCKTSPKHHPSTTVLDTFLLIHCLGFSRDGSVHHGLADDDDDPELKHCTLSSITGHDGRFPNVIAVVLPPCHCVNMQPHAPEQDLF
ncbi:hypothetical protein ILYODFUR_031779 [Ilyodon furcidens]|uniref:Uncharacterized protein n=1 Tax=Ilyodon furcidens TaxID=33524 RepID=A0ABV0UNK2_9TELE